MIRILSFQQILQIVGFLFYITTVNANTLSIPAELEPWQDWVLQKHKDIDCPYLYRKTDIKRCAWPSRLQLQELGKGVDFQQYWEVYGQSWLTLPGDQRLWPADVKLNNQPVEVMERDGRPVIRVEKGRHRVSGRIQWLRKPQYLSIPVDAGLISLSVDGKPAENLNIQTGRLWFNQSTAKPQTDKERDAVKIKVFRKLIDGIPIQLETRIRFAVSGSDRELLVGQLLPDQSKPLQLNSPLPARIEEGGQLRIQVRAGEWEVSLISRYLEPITGFSMRAMDEQWPPQEVWVFQPNRQLRSVTFEGAVPVDPSQMDLPSGWEGLSTYLMTPDTELMLNEKYRGNAAPAENELVVRRQLWLDFDGQGYTAKDRIKGKMNRGWRLNMQPGYALGRAAVNEQPRLITQLDENDLPGLEIREGYLNLDAVSRYQLDAPVMGAIGWSHDVTKLSAQLNLPPGWMLLHASGVDQVKNSWLEQWDLWDVFLCLIIAVAVGQLLGVSWGLLAAVTLVLTYQEHNAPLFIWLNIVAVLALIQVLPVGKFKRLLCNYQYFSLLLLALIALTFSVEQIREGIYPQLERNMVINSARYSSSLGGSVEADMTQAEVAESAIQKRKLSPKTESYALSPAPSKPNVFQQYDSNARIQTGPGEPTWQWQKVNLTWSGPVTQNQDIKFYYLSPLLTRMLKFAQVGLIILLAAGLISSTLKRVGKPRTGGPASSAIGLFPLLIWVNLLPQFVPQAMAEFPPETLLKELESRLLVAPDCAPDCVSINKARIQLQDSRLILRLQIDSLAHMAVPLPTQRQQWLPRIVMLDGKQVPALFQDSKGTLFAAVDAGRHELVMEGPVSADTLVLPFQARPHQVELDIPGWRISGLVDGRIQAGSLQFDRILKKTKATQNQDQLLPRPVDPFVKIERTLYLGADWQLHTRIERMAPSRGSINLQIPLWPGESIVSGGVKITDGKVNIAMRPNQREARWQSSLQQVSEVSVEAADNVSWVEHWRIAASPIWHVKTSGINSTKQSIAQEDLIPEWQPWPREVLRMEIDRPTAVEGAVQTVESAKLDYNPGKRASINTLELQVRASLGGEYELQLPAEGQIQELVVDGQELVVTQDTDTLRVPVRPGLQVIRVKWKTEEDISVNSATPEIRLSTPATNVQLSMNLPRNRWPLFVGGPNIGPAMLYWGVLIVIVLLAVALGICTKKAKLDIPVKTYQWLLLGFGMSTVTAVGGILVVLWFFAMERRARLDDEISDSYFDLIQFGLIVLSMAALLSLVATIPLSLLSTPNMQITGNGSHNFFYQWYQDRTFSELPSGWVISLPIWVYRLVMLSWSLWVVFALLRWLKWGWQCFSKNGLWRRKPKVSKTGQV